jgi:molybdopterin converting factor small subunit
MIVNVRLFGMLGILANQRLVAFELESSATLGDVLAELEKRFGREFVDRIFRVPGEMHSYCQVFVNNAQVNGLETELKTNGAPAEVGIILLMASEGG